MRGSLRGASAMKRVILLAFTVWLGCTLAQCILFLGSMVTPQVALDRSFFVLLNFSVFCLFFWFIRHTICLDIFESLFGCLPNSFLRNSVGALSEAEQAEGEVILDFPEAPVEPKKQNEV